jgi:hypothetical protein
MASSSFENKEGSWRFELPGVKGMEPSFRQLAEHYAIRARLYCEAVARLGNLLRVGGEHRSIAV